MVPKLLLNPLSLMFALTIKMVPKPILVTTPPPATYGPSPPLNAVSPLRTEEKPQTQTLNPHHHHSKS